MATLDAIRRALAEAFAENFKDRGEVGASVSVWRGTSEVCSLHRGFRDRNRSRFWDESTLVPLWSATKGPAAACVLLALEEQGMEPENPVYSIWPELARGTLRRHTVGDLLAHRCGLSALDCPPPVEDYDAVIRALEAQRPRWPPGEAHGYHPRTFGFLADELVRRVAGIPLGVFWRTRIADPLDLELWIGLPESEDHRVAEMLPGRASSTDPASASFYRALADPDSLTRHSFASPTGLAAVRDVNLPSTRRLALPAMGGIGSARALARFYALLAGGGTWSGSQILPRHLCQWASRTRSKGDDLVLRAPTAFSAGFMKDPRPASENGRLQWFGPSPRAFGHPGAGGSHAFADPDSGIAFAYVMNQMERSIFPTERALSLVRRVYQR